MDAATLRAEVEAEWSWRLDELRFFKNQIAHIGPEERRDQYRRALVLMLYAHFEGFCKGAFSVYATAVNGDSLLVKDCSPAIAASALASIFRDLRNSEKKSDFFRKTAPQDSGLHRSYREQEFIERISDCFDTPALIDVDDAVDTESNVSAVVLQKILYRLGMEPNEVSPWKTAIAKLLGRRNAVAHGEERAGVDQKTYAELEQSVADVIERITQLLFNAAMTNLHRRRTLAIGT